MTVPADMIGTHRIATGAEMELFGERIADGLVAGDVLTLTGPLGAGKTTLVRGLGRRLGVRGTVQSPTFVIARSHPSLTEGPTLVHVDAYRLGSPVEFEDLDIDFGASVTVVEWGRDFVDGLCERWWDIEISRTVDHPAVLTVDGPDQEDPRTVTIRVRP